MSFTRRSPPMPSVPFATSMVHARMVIPAYACGDVEYSCFKSPFVICSIRIKTMKYLFNSISNPRVANTWFRSLYEYRLERNPGDLVYAHSVMNALACEECTEFQTTGYYNFTGYEPEEIDRINQTCTAFILPFADIFSTSWVHLLPRYSDLIRQLKIPCIVPCVGIRGEEFDPAHPTRQPFDNEVREFVHTVLDHSSVVGLRGDTTAAYLKFLGFIPEKHFTVVGCPTLYAYGQALPSIQRPIEYPARLGVHLNPRATPQATEFLCSLLSKVKSKDCASIVSQDYREFLHFMFRQDKPWNNIAIKNPRYTNQLETAVNNGRFRFFLNQRPWFDFLKEQDFLIGCRIHGTLLSILAGTPAALIPFESRTRELAKFHGIPVVEPDTIRANASLESVLENIDFSGLQKVQNRNFAHYLDFWRENHVDTFFSHFEKSVKREDFPLERSMPTLFPDDDLRIYADCSYQEQEERDRLWRSIQQKNNANSAKIQKIWNLPSPFK